MRFFLAVQSNTEGWCMQDGGWVLRHILLDVSAQEVKKNLFTFFKYIYLSAPRRKRKKEKEKERRKKRDLKPSSHFWTTPNTEHRETSPLQEKSRYPEIFLYNLDSPYHPFPPLPPFPRSPREETLLSFLIFGFFLQIPFQSGKKKKKNAKGRRKEKKRKKGQCFS